MKQLLRFDWDIIAGIAAAMIAIVLHLLHIVEVDVLFTIVLVLLALLLIRDLRRESHDEQLADTVQHLKTSVQGIQLSLHPPDAVLVGPRHLRAESRRFAKTARGEMVWFNVCFTIFKSQDVFDLMLCPAIENSMVPSIQFISTESERDLLDEFMAPKIRDCRGHDKVAKPRWRDLLETISCILADVDADGSTEALLSFWGEPFMS